MTTENWNKFILNDSSRSRSGLFLQSWEWGEFQKSVGRKVRRYQNENLLAQVVSHSLPGAFYGWDLYRGPIFKKSGIRNLESEITNAIIYDLKNTSGIFLHIEPNSKILNSKFQILNSPNRQPQHTLIVDLRKHEELLLSEMREKTRYNIKIAERHNVIVKENAPIKDFLKLMKETTMRDKFSAHPDSYYKNMLETSLKIKLFVAYHENDALAASVVIFFGDTATYLHGASSNEKRNLMAPYLLHWEIIRGTKADGYNFYDFWGITPENDPKHAWAGITRFKKGFGGEIVVMPEAMELPLRPNFYKLYTLAKRLF